MKNGGPPKCTCSICHEIVLKSTTKHIGGGFRACTRHEGVEEKVNRLKIEEKERLRNLSKKITQRKNFNDKNIYRSFTPTCVCCETKGMQEVELNYQIMMMWKIYEKTTGERVNPFCPAEEIKTAIKLAFEKERGYMPVPLLIIDAGKIPQDVKQRIIKNQEMLIFSPLLLICRDCMTKHNIHSYINTSKADIGIKHLLTLGSIMNDIMDKDVEKIIEEYK